MAARRRRKKRPSSSPVDAGPATGAQPAATPSPGPPPVRTTTGQKLALLAGGLVLGILGLGAVEGLLVLAGVGGATTDSLAGFAPGHLVFEAREEGGEEWRVTRPSKLLWFNPQRFPTREPGDGLRIFSLGGSTTFGRPYDDAVSFSSWLRLLLAESAPGGPHEVINAGGISYASYRIDVLLREVLAYSPDALVVYTGHNEFLEERTWPELSRGPDALQRAQALLSRLRVAALVRRTVLGPAHDNDDPLTSRGLGDDVRARLDVQAGLEAFHRDDVLRARVIREFQENLERIVGRARDAGVAVVLVKPASNLKDFPPFKSEMSPGLDEDARQRLEAALLEGAALLDAGEAGQAREVLAQAVALDPRHARARYLLGRAALALGDQEAARVELEAAREEDVCPLRAPAEVVAAVGRVAEAFDVPVIDLPGLLEARARADSGTDLLGNEQFLDHVHPTIAVHQRIAEAVLEALGRSGLPVGDGVPAARRMDLYAAHLGTLDAAYFARRDVNLGKVLGWAGQLEEAQRAFERAVAALPDDPDAHFYLAMGLEQEGRPEEAAAHYRRAAELAPAHFRARFNLGKALQTLGDARGALEALQAALALKPGDAATEYELARTYGALDRFEDARAALAAARAADPNHKGLDAAAAALTHREQELGGDPLAAARARVARQPGDPAARNALGEALGRARDLEGAEAAFREALGQDPAFVPALRNLAILLQLKGDLVEASRALEEVARLRPGDARAQLELGVLLRARGDVTGAVGAFRRAVALEPGLARGWVNLGAALVASGDRPGALLAFQEAVRQAPGDADAHFNLGTLLRESGREAEARAHFERAKALEGSTAAAAGSPR